MLNKETKEIIIKEMKTQSSSEQTFDESIENQSTANFILMNKLTKNPYSPVFLTFIMLALLFITTALIAYNTSKPKEAAKTEVVNNQPIPTAAIKLNDDQLDWNIYTNEEFGYTVHYPKNWEVIEAKDETGDQPQGATSILIDTEIQKVTFLGPTNETWQAIFKISVLSNQENLNTEEWAENLHIPLLTSPSTNLASPSSEYMIDGQNAKSFSVFAFDRNETLIGFIKDGVIYTINFTADTPNDPDLEEHTKIYNQMLSSFKFLESN